MSVKVNEKYLEGFVSQEEIKKIAPIAKEAFSLVKNHNGAGSSMLGWLTLPENYDRDEFYRIKKAAEKIRKTCDVFLVIGIGGSYLGARAAIEFLKSPIYNSIRGDDPEVYFVGNSISPSSISDIMKACDGKDICINAISKSGTTTEPAVAFRIFRKYLEEKYGEEKARERIYVTTDRAKGKLKEFSTKKGYETFVVPDDIGGRYSVLSAVGLLPIAVAGCDIDELMHGALDAKNEYSDFSMDNACVKYAALRNILYGSGKSIEILASYEPALQMLSEWWKQLFGESEGKDKKSLFPASVMFSTDLHSLGQYIQDGTRNIFETVIDIKKSKDNVTVPYDQFDVDGLNFLSGNDFNDINHKAMLATLIAHNDGGVPNIVLELEDRSEYSLGYLFYFFELSCAISGYILGVNPFNQPGVEAYKKNMFALLGKPGYEEHKKELETRIK